MRDAPDWLIVCGFFLLLVGVGLRVTLMMRGNDTVPTGGTPVAGRAAVQSFRAANPRSKLPLVAWISIGLGLLLLIAGVLLEIRQ